MILTNHSSFFEELGLTSFTTLQNTYISVFLAFIYNYNYEK